MTFYLFYAKLLVISKKTAHYITTGEKLVTRRKRSTKTVSHNILAEFRKQSLKTFLLNHLVADRSNHGPKHQNTASNLDHKNENFELPLKPPHGLETIINAIEMFCLLNDFKTFSQSSFYCKAEKIGETMFVTITQSQPINNCHIWITVNYQPFSRLDCQTVNT